MSDLDAGLHPKTFALRDDVPENPIARRGFEYLRRQVEFRVVAG